MLQTNLLSPEQKALLPIYQEKWRRIIASRKPINRDRATAGINQAYIELGLAAPKILFFDSPAAAARDLSEDAGMRLGNFLSEFSVIPGVFNTLIDQVIQENIPLEQMISEKSATEGVENPMIFPLLMPEIANSLNIHGMNQLSLQIQKPFLEAIEKSSTSAGEFSLFLSVGDNFTKVISQGAFRLVVWQQQQAIRSQIHQQPWGDFLLNASDFLWQKVQPLTEPVVVGMQYLGDRTWDKFWELLCLHPQIKENLEQLDFFWKGLKNSLFSSSLNSSSLAQVDFLPALDFSISVLGHDYGIKNWSAIQQLNQECCWVYPFEKACIVIERPHKYHFQRDSDRFHGEGQPALQFRDGYAMYAYNGVFLPEKYGKVHPHQWQANWILQERNAEIRRVLIQGIGYERLYRELRAETLDTWREYRLLKIANVPTSVEVDGREVEEEAIHLLKMICPSTAHIHVLRVPPDIYTSREAIRWVNWDTDPEEFAVAT